MKKFYFTTVLIFSVFVAKSQIINIPDANFKNQLVNTLCADINNDGQTSEKVDTNDDGEIDVAEAAAVYMLDLADSDMNTDPEDITDITGIGYFTNLESLDIKNNNISSLPALPLGLKIFDCSYNPITELNVSVLSALEKLTCQNTLATTINVSGLENLWWFFCNLSTQLTTVNASNCTALKYMGCGNSQISSLNIDNTPLLISLHCVENNLVSLDVSGRTMLTTLNCDQNQLTSLSFEGCTSLNYISCSQNQLTSLDFSGFESLSGISCYSNQLTSLNVSGCSDLITLMCYTNHLTTLDVSDSPLLYKLWAIDNDLTWLSVKNGSTIIYDNASWLIQDNPLEYLCVDENETEIAYFTTFCQNAGMNPTINTYCSFTPEGDYSIITGTVRYSQDNISCTDGQPLQHFRISLADSSSPEIPIGAVYTNDEGQYTIYTSQSLTIVPIIDNAYFTSNPALATFTYTTPQTYSTDFCVTNTTTSLHDLDIVVLPLTVARPGLDASYKVIVTNNGNSTESGTVNFQYEDAILTYANSDISSPVSTDGNISWNITGLGPLSSLSYTITFHVDTNPQNTGTVLSCNAGVEIDNTDNEPQNNSFTLSQVILNSYDPNDKQVAEGASITPEKAGEYLHYLVRFQNTGTAEAINVVVKDMLADNLDWSTFQPISASHAYRTTLTQGNKAEFFFEGINLPAEDDNEPGSHGYIAFKVKPAAGAAIGDVFENTADIYFDYNAPIITNTVSTAVQVLSVGSLNFDKYFTLYPVPAKDVLHLDVKDGSAIKAISVYNTLGQLVISSAGSDLKDINTSSLKTGTYIVKVFSDKGTAVKKIIKQ